MKKRLFLLVMAMLMVFMSVTLSGCTVIYGKLKVEIKDKNGDDTALAVLSDEDICAEDHRFYCFVYGYAVDGVRSDPSGSDDYFDNDSVEAFAKTPYSGVSVIMRTYGRSDTIQFFVNSELTTGNLRIVLLDEHRQIIYDFAVGKDDSYTVTDALDKVYEIRIAGESAEFDITASRVMTYVD
ncbi:MAG: hypothetical protein ACI4N6_00285 [Eubacteriales bacterium]